MRNFKFNKNLTRIARTLHEDKYIFLIISHSLLLRVRNVSHKIVEKIKTHISCSVTLFFLESPAVYETMWRNIVEPDSPQVTIWLLRIACWITKATNTHSEYVIFIVFSLQQ